VFRKENDFVLIFVFNFVVFVADGSHFDTRFKMVLNFTECLKWCSFSQFMFYLVIFWNAVSLTKHCTSDTICIGVCYVYCNVHMAN